VRWLGPAAKAARPACHAWRSAARHGGALASDEMGQVWRLEQQHDVAHAPSKYMGTESHQEGTMLVRWQRCDGVLKWHLCSDGLQCPRRDPAGR
jgi:hypothetical protein